MPEDLVELAARRPLEPLAGAQTIQLADQGVELGLDLVDLFAARQRRLDLGGRIEPVDVFDQEAQSAPAVARSKT